MASRLLRCAFQNRLMLSLIKKLFGSSTAHAKTPQSRTHPHFEPNPQMQSVEVANLCLARILERLPDELKALVLKMPDASVTVALPIATIVKQLPGGAVKVSLATLHRQAPPGVLAPLPPGDKRMVEVPLAEVFRHIKPTVFKRRNDQRNAAALDSKFNLFGDAENPFQVAPTAPDDEPEEVEPLPEPEPPRTLKVELPAPAAESFVPEFKLARDPAPEPAPEAPRVLAPPPELFEPTLRKLPPAPAAPLTMAAAPVPAAPASATAAPAPPRINPDSITIPVEPLSGAWPEPIRHELAVLNGSARVSLPKDAVSAGMARGKVTFTWSQIRTWIEPALGESSATDGGTELTLPLKIVAPIFLAATKKPKAELRPAEFDEEIPALFAAARAAAPADEPPLAAPAAEAVAEAVAEAPHAPLTFTIEAAPAHAAQEVAAPAAEPVAEPAPAATPMTVGALFGFPEKTDWTPAELVSNLAKLPGVSGAVVALQEGLLVAHSMPGDVKTEVIAAFLPQLFARLNQYAGEMKLGEVDDLLFTTHGAHCQIYRLGYVYFAVLGKPGEPLPWADLRLVVDELGRQTHKS